MASSLFPYDNVITHDGLLRWAVQDEDHSLVATVVFDGVSARLLDGIKNGGIGFVMRSRLCQLGLDAQLERLEVVRSREGRVECYVRITYAEQCPLAADVWGFLAADKPRVPLGKLFLGDAAQEIDYDAAVKNTMTTPPVIEAPGISRGPDDLAIVPVEGVVYEYLESAELTREQIVLLLTQGSRADIDYFRRTRRVEVPLEIAGRGWLVTRLPKFVVREHFATIEGLTSNGELVEGLRHASARLFDPLSFKGVPTHSMIEVFNDGEEKASFDGVALRFHRPKKIYCSVHTPPNERLQDLLRRDEHLRAVMDDSLKGSLVAGSRRIQHAAFIVEHEDLDRIEADKTTQIAPQHVSRFGSQLDVTECPEYELLLAIRNGYIKAPGILLSYYFPRWDIASWIEAFKGRVHALVFREPSSKNGIFFSDYDVSRLRFLHALGIQIIWLRDSGAYHYVVRDDSGFFMPDELRERFLAATFFACYGSSARVAPSSDEFSRCLLGLQDLFGDIGVVTGGGPGVMEAANRAALQNGMLSAACCLQTELSRSPQEVNEFSNVVMGFDEYCRHIRQNNFSVARFPIFFPGGVGTLEEIGIEMCNLKLGIHERAPYVFVGNGYWRPLFDMLERMCEAGMADPAIIEQLHMADGAEDIPKVYEAFLSEGDRSFGRLRGPWRS